MPIYEFECLECKEVFEKIVLSAEKVKDVLCTQCQSTKVRKTISAGSHRLAGGGGVFPSAPQGGCGGKSRFT
ncbi:FmdB family zinc ribbon protein [Desulfosediminicola flagellatus]|uniref:FmdB family zinc ribbon protein n=1 Tax=Desulfosediminicola flagellatus TaxID=2569541 RepID=UPI0010AD98C9|nr:zinc ribbon domain-containing protein [Desulfosediminicola flagellatus]